MQSQETEPLTAQLDEMWREHRTYLQYLLVGLTHDIHLADDLLQQTYLNARSGMAGYAGGSSRAWLAQIARRVFFTHRRRRYVQVEQSLECSVDEAGEDSVGSLDHLMLIELRRAISELGPQVRAALIMKHYGGLTYTNIAKRQSCPVGTAKWRVSSALGRLRTVLAALEEVRGKMECKEMGGTLLADYVYRLLPRKKESAVQSHLESCLSCREEAEALRKVATALDAFEQENKSQVFYELDEHGVPVVYAFKTWQNNTDKPTDVLRFADTGKGVQPSIPLHVAVAGEPARVDVETVEENQVVYAVRLKRPMQPGERRDMLVVRRMDSGAQTVAGQRGVWMFRPGLIIETPGEVSVRVEAVRLPPGAKLLSCNPQPDELYTNDTTTLVWRRVLADWETFALVVVYQLG